jgi:hypothetical protein
MQDSPTDRELAILNAILTDSAPIITHRADSAKNPEDIKHNCECDHSVGFNCEWCAENEVFSRLDYLLRTRKLELDQARNISNKLPAGEKVVVKNKDGKVIGRQG